MDSHPTVVGEVEAATAYLLTGAYANDAADCADEFDVMKRQVGWAARATP